MFFTCLYTLTYQGRANSFDGQSMFAATQALGDRGSLVVTNSALGVLGAGGHYYSKYNIGQSLAELPLYLLGKGLGVLAGSKGVQVAEAVAMLTNPILMALCCVAAYGVIRALGYPRQTAIRATLVLGIATTFWPYSKSDFSEPLLTLCLLLAVLCVLYARQLNPVSRQQLTYDLLAGVALAAAVLTKYAALAFVPVFCLYLTLTLTVPRTLWRWLRRQLALLVPVFLAGCVVLLINLLRFGSITKTGYDALDHPFSGSFLHGFWGLLMSPYRGMLFYDPLLFVGLLAFPLFLLRRPREAILPLGLIGVSLLLYGTYVGWDGGLAWGTRYLVPVLPYLILPLLEVGCFGPRTTAEHQHLGAFLVPQPRLLRRLLALGTATLVTLGVTVQLLAITMNSYIRNVYWDTAALDPALKSSISASPLAMAIWTLPMNVRYAFTRTFPATGYASTDYPFGPPFPPAAHMPAAIGPFFEQYFWFTQLPHPAVVCAVGAVVLGTSMALAGRALWRRCRLRRIRTASLEA